MWLMTPRGFYSAVQKKGDVKTGMVTVRARNRKDLEALADFFPNVKIAETKGTDYPCRIRVKQQAWAEAVRAMATEIDYSNFKDEVKKKQGWQRASVYSRIWSVLLDLEDRVIRWPSNYPSRGSDAYGRSIAYDNPTGSTRLSLPETTGTPPVGDHLDDDGYCVVCGWFECKDRDCMDEMARAQMFGSATLFEPQPVETTKPKGKKGRGNRRGGRRR